MAVALTVCAPSLALAQQQEAEPAGAIALEPGADSDALIAQRISGIFSRIPQFDSLQVNVTSGAGVLGLAISFAVKDSMENYISSIMLSIRQPFRAQEHVIINDYEGVVVRLTSRSTVLMTLDGNHLRIPNATVFKAVILNYSRNPQRRFDFVLGVDAEDDPALAIQTGLTAMQQLDWVLGDPEPNGIIESVGDSNILIKFTA